MALAALLKHVCFRRTTQRWLRLPFTGSSPPMQAALQAEALAPRCALTGAGACGAASAVTVGRK
eukprot:300571-Chlamydomonas_euryale.AAC.23